MVWNELDTIFVQEKMRPDTIWWDDVKEGEELPHKTRRITRTDIIAGAVVATHDYMQGHHDHEFMQKIGLKDIILSIPSTTGYSGKYLNDWTGPNGELKVLSIRLEVPCTVGDTMEQKGKVVKKYVQGNEHLVDVEFTFSVAMGPHCTGKATVALPKRGSS
jgi:acyl dehydratase